MVKFVVVVVLALAAACFARPPPHIPRDEENETEHHLERRHLVGGLNDYGGSLGGVGGHGQGGHLSGLVVPAAQSFSKSSASATSVSGSAGAVLG